MSHSSPALVADIGGTNARFGLADLDTLEIGCIEVFLGRDHPTLAGAAAAYLDARDVRPRTGAFAVAAPVTGDSVRFTNSPWVFTLLELRHALGLDELLLLNDFEALALGLPHLGPSDLHQIGGGAPPERATKAVLGPGTGLGVAGLAWSPAGWVALPGEGGHTTLAVESEREFAILQRLREGRERVSAERVLSGPGLADLYRILAGLRGQAPESLEPAEVVTRALARSDAAAEEALDHFVTWAGRFAGDVALLYGARGGVYLGGGIPPRILGALTSGRFRRAFEAKGRMSAYVAAIPAYVILSGDAALKGAAAALGAALAGGAP